MYLDLEELRWRKREDSQEEIVSRSDWRTDMSEGELIGLNMKILSASKLNKVEGENVRLVKPLM